VRIDLPQMDSWSQVSDLYREALALNDNSKVSVQVYLSPHHALWEITQALAEMYPHRKTIGYFKNAGSEFESIAIEFAKREYTVKAFTRAELEDPTSWAAASAKDMLFFMNAADDPVTGELFDFPTLDAQMKDQRIFRITLSHAAHQFKKVATPSLYEVSILSLAKGRTLALLGERAKLTPPMAGNLTWSKPSPSEIATQLKIHSSDEIKSLKDRVLKFEKKLPRGVEAYFAPEVARTYDRSVISFADIDGLSLITELARELQITLAPPGAQASLETTSLCRWDNPRLFEWFPKALESTHLRGLVVLSIEILNDSLPKQIEKVHREIREAQGS
jgi:phosphopantetheinyl transferase (holo-ACP synthase)